MSYFRAMIIFFASIGCTLSFANDANTSPKGLCIFDIDGTLTELGSYAAVKTCNDLGYGLGVNTGESKDEAQISMNGIYNGVDRRAGGGLSGMRPENGEGYFSMIQALYSRYYAKDSLPIIGNGSSTDPVLGSVEQDQSFQYSGGCKNNFNHLCTNWPYKHEGLETIAEFYYPNYVRSQDSYNVKGGQSDASNECIVLFDDQISTIESYANNMSSALGKTDGEYAKRFRGVHILQPDWTFSDAASGKNTVCKTVKQLPAKCQPTQEIYNKVCEN